MSGGDVFAATTETLAHDFAPGRHDEKKMPPVRACSW
jgi:hypothetical protein